MWRKDRDAFFCEGVSPKIVRGTGRIFGAGKRGRKLMQKAQNSGAVFANGVAILEFGSGRVSSGHLESPWLDLSPPASEHRRDCSRVKCPSAVKMMMPFGLFPKGSALLPSGRSAVTVTSVHAPTSCSLMGFCWLITVWGNDEKSEHYRHANTKNFLPPCHRM
jgi:hypothetical protein